MKIAWKRDYRFFSTPGSADWVTTLRVQEHAYWVAKVHLRVFYGFLLYYAVVIIHLWDYYHKILPTDPLWPVIWLKALDDPLIGIRLILVGSFIAAIIGALFCEFRWARVLVFIGLLEYLALKYSYGGHIGHGMHLWLIVSFLLIFLPPDWVKIGKVSRLTQQATLRLYWCCQSLVMLTFSMSGLGKLGGAFYQIFIGQIHLFHPDAFSLHIAERLLQNNSSSLMGNWFIDHPQWGIPLMVGMLYLQLFAFWAAFRPSLHRLWGFGLILFQIGTSLIFSINFPFSIFLIALLFLYSPFKPESVTWGKVLRDLPLFGFFIRKLKAGNVPEPELSG